MNSYLKFLSRNKLYTAIQAAGLAIALAFVILIGSYIWQQLAVIRENPDHDRIYAVHCDSGMYLSYWDRDLLETLPEVEAITRISWNPDHGVARYGDQPHIISCLSVDPEFFDIFPYYRIEEGTAEHLASGTAALVSRSFATRIDDGSGVIGKELTVEDKTYIIDGIIEDFDHTLFRPSDIIVDARDPRMEQYEKFSVVGPCLTLFRTVKGCDETLMREKVLALFKENFHPGYNLQLASMRDIYFCDYSYFLNHGNLSVLRLLTAVVLLLLLSAILNYINLSLALTGRRAREMATRRLLGAGRSAVVLRHIAESVLFTAFCFALALLLAWALTPMMGRLLASASEVSLRFILSPGYLLCYLAGILLTGCLAGVLPALAVSHFAPLDVVRGTFTYRSKLVFSRIVIIVQNVLAVALLAVACVMELQMKHMMERPLNADVTDLFYLSGFIRQVEEARPLEDRLRALPCVQEIGYGRGFPGSLSFSVGYPMDDGRNYKLRPIICDSTFFRMLDFRIIEDFGHPLTGSLWLSESAFTAAQVSDTSASFARRFIMNGSQAEFLGGIVRDFPGESAASADGTLEANTGILIDRPEHLLYCCDLLIHTAGPHKEAQRQILAAWEAFETERIGTCRTPLESGYIEDLNARQLDTARNTMRLLEIFMVLSLLIALLGLVAMSTHFSRQGMKEIAVRKVFGSDTQQETFRMVRNYMLTVLIALGFGIPIAIFAAERWLAPFAYRIGHYGWVFPIVALAVIAIDLGAILWQTLRATRANPADSLKNE